MGFAKIKSISKADFLLGPIFDFDRPSTPTRPCSAAGAPGAGTDGCTCSCDLHCTRGNRAGSMETNFGPKMITFAARNLLPWALYAAPLGPAPRAARTGGRGRDACLRLRVPVPTHQRTAVGDFGTKNNHGRPDPHPHRACTRRGASCSRSRHPRADRTCATGNGRADTHGGGTGPSRDRAAHAPPPPPVARTQPRQRAVETQNRTISCSFLPS